MTPGFIRQATLGAAVVALLTACGGGSGPVAGISGTGITSSGTVTGFGSIFVNGVEFETDGATIIVNGEPAAETDLQVGQVVTVTGTLTDDTRGDADTVVFDRLVDGPIENIDRQAGIITALDQIVRIDESTAFIDVAPMDLAELNLIAVSGFVNDRGEIVATALQRGSENFAYGTRTDVQGSVTNLTPTTFNIGNLAVDYGNAQIDESAGALVNGATAEIFGIQTEQGGVFFASRLRVVDPTLGEPGERVELEGIVTDFNAPADFFISGQRVNASGATQEDATGLALGAGVRIEVEGEIDNNGVLIAEAFFIRPASDIRLSAALSSVDAANGSLEILGRPVRVASATRFIDVSVADDRHMRLKDLRFGDRVDVQAFRNARGDLVANGVVRSDFESVAQVRGPLARNNGKACAGDSLVIAGVKVRTDTATFRLGNGTRTNIGVFCALLAGSSQPEAQLEAKGTQNGDELMAATVRFVK